MEEELTMDDIRSGMKYLIAEALIKKYGNFESFGIDDIIATGKAWVENKKIDFNVSIRGENK